MKAKGYRALTKAELLLLKKYRADYKIIEKPLLQCIYNKESGGSAGNYRFVLML